ncbi:hypothetical protein BJ875DRAFT_445427 [Amylocarpus encephaloides]|uniref:Uncharacterized protein n=1 Tax=Amylocarpus encephaloides TaxID=45428 RepID=A0A9P8C1J1_9HELO|nr:hypothetical protein BJ875DRAFT_445427 [Amylocarpus encephaloides]
MADSVPSTTTCALSGSALCSLLSGEQERTGGAGTKKGSAFHPGSSLSKQIRRLGSWSPSSTTQEGTKPKRVLPVHGQVGDPDCQVSRLLSRLKTQDSRLKAQSSKLNSQLSRPKTQGSTLNSQDSRLNSQL